MFFTQMFDIPHSRGKTITLLSVLLKVNCLRDPALTPAVGLHEDHEQPLQQPLSECRLAFLTAVIVPDYDNVGSP